MGADRSAQLAREASTLGDLLRRRARLTPHDLAYHEKRDGQWRATSWSQFLGRAERIAAGLIRLGLGPGERVAILGPTSGRWCDLDLGAHLAGLVTVGLYPMQPVEQLRYLIEHSDARVVFVDGATELQSVLEAVREIPGVVAVVPWSAAAVTGPTVRDPRLMSFDAFETGEVPEAALADRLAARAPDDVAILVYTSGTTGPPKAAQISHRNVLTLLSHQDEMIVLERSDVSFSFLPLPHVAERVLGLYGRIAAGVQTYFASSMGAVLQEVKEVRPTLFGSVPRLFEKAYGRIFGEVERQKPVVRAIFRWAERVGRERVRTWQRGEPIPPLLALSNRIADRLVFRKIRAAFGGRVRQFVTGAAPLAPEILEFFWAAGIPIYEVYGMTELTALTHANGPGRVRLGTVGRPFGGFEQRLAGDGEILLRGPWIFRGYLKDPEATAATVIDGWLHTGDIGTIDADGYLRITDRKKHLIITAGGKNLTPANIEAAIKSQDPLISQVHAHGDKRPYCSAIVAPSPVETLEWGVGKGAVSRAEADARIAEVMANPSARSKALHESMAKVVRHPELGARIREAVRRGNARLAHVETVRRVFLLDRDFSQEQGELTPTMKVKRKEIETKFADTLDRLYREPSFGIVIEENS